MQNTPKTEDIWCDFSKKLGNLPFLCTNTHNSNILVGENSEKSVFSTNHKQNFHKISEILYVGLQGYKSKFLSYHAKNCHSIINLQNKSCTNYHNYCRKHQKFIKLGTSHNRIYPIQNCEKFSPIVKLNLALFSSVMAIIAPILLIALMLNVKRQQLTAHKIYCEGKRTKVLQTHVFLSLRTFMFLGVTNAIGSISQNKHQLNTSNKNVNLCENTKNTNYLLKIHKLSKNGSFFLHKKQCFN